MQTHKTYGGMIAAAKQMIEGLASGLAENGTPDYKYFGASHARPRS